MAVVRKGEYDIDITKTSEGKNFEILKKGAFVCNGVLANNGSLTVKQGDVSECKRIIKEIGED